MPAARPSIPAVLIELDSRLSDVMVSLCLSTRPHSCAILSVTSAFTISMLSIVLLLLNALTTARRSLSVARIHSAFDVETYVLLDAETQYSND